MRQEPNLGLAGVLSFLLPGLGQIYRGEVVVGMFWMMLTFAGYLACFFPGLLLHLVSIVFAVLE